MLQKAEFSMNCLSFSFSGKSPLLIGLYSALCAATFSVLAPHPWTSHLSTAVLVCLVLSAYYIRLEEQENSLTRCHMTYVIGSFWKGLVVLLFSLIFSLTFLLFSFQAGSLEISPLDPCMASGELSPCMSSFTDANKSGFRIASVIVIAPIILYFLFRMFRGLAYALKGQPPQ